MLEAIDLSSKDALSILRAGYGAYPEDKKSGFDWRKLLQKWFNRGK